MKANQLVEALQASRGYDLATAYAAAFGMLSAYVDDETLDRLIARESGTLSDPSAKMGA